MKDIYAVGIGVAAFAAGCAAVGIYAIDKTNLMNDKLTGISRGLSYIQDNVDLQVPEEVAKSMMRDAAYSVAQNAVNSATESAKKEIKKEISDQVKSVVKDAYKNVEADVRHQLEAQINLQTIEKIQGEVSEKVAKQIVSNALFTKSSTKEDIIKTCVDNGMDAWDIRRILEASK